jgi:uncharacterized repeat protein (TIGR01451 family)
MMDLGTAVVPFPAFISVYTTFQIIVDSDDNGVISPGDTVEYVIQVKNVGPIDIAQDDFTVVNDALDDQAAYLLNSVSYNLLHDDGGIIDAVAVRDDTNTGGATPFPLDGDGLDSQATITKKGGTLTLTFRVVVNSDAEGEIFNTGVVNYQTKRFPYEVRQKVSTLAKSTRKKNLRVR